MDIFYQKSDRRYWWFENGDKEEGPFHTEEEAETVFLDLMAGIYPGGPSSSDASELIIEIL